MALNPRNTNSRLTKFLAAVSFLYFLSTSPLLAQSWTVTGTGGKSFTNWHGQAATQTISVEWNRWRWRGIEISAGAMSYFVRQPKSWFSDDYGDGNETIVGPRIYAMTRKVFGSALTRPYIELGGGPLWTPKQVPDSTSQMNFVTDAGAGVQFTPASAHTSLILGYRFSHISNGGLSSRNPGWNVSSIAFGVRVH